MGAVLGVDHYLYAARVFLPVLPTKGQETARRSSQAELRPPGRRPLHFAEHLGTVGGHELLAAILL